MSLRVTFSKSITSKMTCEYDKDTGVEIESVFRSIYHVACGGIISNLTF